MFGVVGAGESFVNTRFAAPIAAYSLIRPLFLAIFLADRSKCTSQGQLAVSPTTACVCLAVIRTNSVSNYYSS